MLQHLRGDHSKNNDSKRHRQCCPDCSFTALENDGDGDNDEALTSMDEDRVSSSKSLQLSRVMLVVVLIVIACILIAVDTSIQVRFVSTIGLSPLKNEESEFQPRSQPQGSFMSKNKHQAKWLRNSSLSILQSKATHRQRRVRTVEWQSCPGKDETEPNEPIATVPLSTRKDTSADTTTSLTLRSLLYRTTISLSSENVHSNAICIVALQSTATTDPIWIPIARSYNGHDWERHAGRDGVQQQSVKIQCETVGCILSLPTPGPGQVYTLTSYFSSTESSHLNQYARFLEQATFGATRRDLEYLETLGAVSAQESTTKTTTASSSTTTTTSRTTQAMATWIYQQQSGGSNNGDGNAFEPTLHRVLFRRHVNAAFHSSNPYGTVTHPCHAHAFYRQWTFSPKHAQQHVYIARYKQKTPKRILSLNGRVVTVVNGPLYHKVQSVYTQYADEQSHRICSRPKSGVGASFRLWSQIHGRCEDVYIGDPDEGEEFLFHGNPPIRFDPLNGVVPKLVVSLDNAKGIVAPALADDEFFSKQTTASPSQPHQSVKISHSLTDSICDSVTHGHGKISVVFGLYQGEYYVHDPRFLLHENTLDQPWADGGGRIVQQTEGTEREYEARCANAPRTFVNEGSCFLSSSLDACTRNIISEKIGEYGRGVVVCGSPGEVANDLRLGGEHKRGAFDLVTEFDRTSIFQELQEQRRIIWTSAVLWAPDQLRQRMAWALYQLLIVNSSVQGNSMSEDFLTYYDIFVRHAFNNFRAVLKEVCFSRMMGQMLSFAGSTSTGFQWTRVNDGIVEYPDENFAREIMQLFTIGLYELHKDGTPIMTNGNTIRTYSNDDIMEYARVWTGFRGQSLRGNSVASANRIDPMFVDALRRDVLPKMGLKGQYIGHGYPLCTDLPIQHFLKRGAKYRLLGYSYRPELQDDPSQWAVREDVVWFVANRTAGTPKSLHSILCGAPLPTYKNSPCSYPPVVVLSENIDCHGTEECSVNSVRTVKVGDVFYEYVQRPCVQQAFFANPQKIKKRDSFKYETMYMCADPRTEIAAAACCLDNGSGEKAHAETLYWGERVRLSTAQARCQSKAELEREPFDLCTSTGSLRWKNGWAFDTPFLWFGNVPCLVQAKLAKDGKVAVVHWVPDENPTVEREKILTDKDTKTFFRVLWSDPAEVDSLVQSCASPCQKTQDGYCLCNVSTTEETAFDDIPTRIEILSGLRYGAFHPSVYGLPYDMFRTDDNVTVYRIHETNETVFEVVDDYGVLQRRKNLRSTVNLVGTTLSFPNPVHFISLAEPTERDALYETDAAIDQLFYHKNTAPFIARHLAQRFGHSNPTPRYIETIAEAFAKGRYIFNDGSASCISFGEGSYGDLAATVAAVLLDREARNVVLDNDPAHGSMKEPILKLIGVMRGLEFKTTPEFPLPRFLVDLQQAIGQMVFEAPSIFSFFLPEHQPTGVIAEAGLVSPEAQIHSTPQVISLVNGLMTLMKYGSDRCFGGFGQTLNWDKKCERRIPGSFVNMSGYLSYDPSSAGTIVDELATIMTSGRLNSRSRSLIKAVIANESDTLNASIKAQQLIATTSEFHSTGTIYPNDQVRQTNKISSSGHSVQPYKAVVVVMLRGGYDSYNLIVPRTCSGTNSANQNIVDQYDRERGPIRVEPEERNLIIDATGSGQPCETFAIHERMPIVQELYNNDNLCFFMNTGLLNQDVTKDTFEALTVSQLFAHNAMQREVQKIDPYEMVVRSGFLGRLGHILNGPSYSFRADNIGINSLWYAVTGNQTFSSPPIVMGESGAQKFNSKPKHETFEPRDFVWTLNSANHMSSSLFGEAWSDLFVGAVKESDFLADALEKVTLPNTCGSRSLNTVVQLMATREDRRSDRDMFFLGIGGWDHHTSLKEGLDEKFDELNDAITCYVDNVKHLNLWENVTLVVMSEFGRTLTPNSNLGSDHGWAGHYFALGGPLKGKKFFGEYPSDLTSDSPLNTGRGRMIPTLSWESMLSPIMEWMGARLDDIPAYILPNFNQAGTPLIRSSEMFRSDEEL